MNWSYWKVIKKQIWVIIIFFVFLFSIVLVAWKVINYKDIETTPSLLISLLSLCVSGATSVIALMLPNWRKPILEIKLEESPVFSKSHNQDPSSWFHRLCVINLGLRPAENCIGKLIEIRDEKLRRITKFDPLPLCWTHQNAHSEFIPVTIFGRGDFAILDILQEKVVLKEDECETFNEMRNWNRDDYPHDISKEFISATEDQFPILRLYLPDPEKFPYYDINSVSPGSKPILIPGTYFLLIGVYAKNGFVKPVWYRLDIELSSKAEIDKNFAKSKTTLKKASRKEKRALK